MDFGSVSNFKVLDSLGYIVDTSYTTFSDIEFTVLSEDTYYVLIEGPSFGEAQYSVKYQSSTVNYPAMGSNPIIIGSINDGQYTVGETVTADLFIADLNGYNANNVAVGWYLIRITNGSSYLEL